LVYTRDRILGRLLASLLLTFLGHGFAGGDTAIRCRTSFGNRLWRVFEDVVDNAQYLGFFGGHEVVALHATAHLFVGVLRVLYIDFGELALDFDDFLGVYQDVRSLTLGEITA